MMKNFLSALFLVGFSAYAWFGVWLSKANSQFVFIALNIGQGDAIYIRTREGTDILVDCGPDRTILAELGVVMPPSDRTLEYVFTTHPDSDHIAGCMELTDRYVITNLITNGHGKNTHVAEQFAVWVQTQTLLPRIVRRGDRIDIDADVWIEVLHPTNEEHEDTNDDSLVMILHDRGVRIALTGDASSVIEEDILATHSPQLIDVDLLKVGHHGSRFSTSDQWLAATTPTIAVLSAGIDNRYHHPHPTVLYRLRKTGVQTFRTEKQGRITCYSDGVSISCAPQRN